MGLAHSEGGCVMKRHTTPFISLPAPLVGEDRGGGSRRPTRQASDGAFDNLLDPRDPPPIGRSAERPSFGQAMPAPTRGAGALTPSIFPNAVRSRGGGPILPRQSSRSIAVWAAIRQMAASTAPGSGSLPESPGRLVSQPL